METAELRQNPRMPLLSKVFIELTASGVDGSQRGRVALCDILDVSRNGMRVSLDAELTTGAILHIGVAIPGREEPLYLAGEVIYCRPEDNAHNRWSAGFRLIDASNSDIESWQRLAERYVSLAEAASS